MRKKPKVGRKKRLPWSRPLLEIQALSAYQSEIAEFA
jgi:hypothetical protein